MKVNQNYVGDVGAENVPGDCIFNCEKGEDREVWAEFIVHVLGGASILSNKMRKYKFFH